MSSNQFAAGALYNGKEGFANLGYLRCHSLIAGRNMEFLAVGGTSLFYDSNGLVVSNEVLFNVGAGVAVEVKGNEMLSFILDLPLTATVYLSGPVKLKSVLPVPNLSVMFFF